jgi:hypothetical protein
MESTGPQRTRTRTVCLDTWHLDVRVPDIDAVCRLRASTYHLQYQLPLPYIHTYMHANPSNPSTCHAGQLHDLAVAKQKHKTSAV